MSRSTVENVVIIGTGCAGLTAAIYTARANLNPLVLEGPQPGGQLTTTSEVENFPGFPDAVDGFQLMDSLRQQAAKFGARFEQSLVASVDFSAMPRQLVCSDRTVLARSVIIATGASPRLTGVPGERELFGGKGVTTCATCDGSFYRHMHVAVIGGGDSAAEEASFLTRFASQGLSRSSPRHAPSFENHGRSGHFANPKIEPVWNSVPLEYLADETGEMRALRIKNIETGTESELDVKCVFVAIGHTPNTSTLQGQAGYGRERLLAPTPRHEDQHPGRLRGGRCGRSRLSPGGHRRWDGLPGCDRSGTMARRARGIRRVQFAPGENCDGVSTLKYGLLIDNELCNYVRIVLILLAT
jgi:thioredoxin reductase (NADPH)